MDDFYLAAECYWIARTKEAEEQLKEALEAKERAHDFIRELSLALLAKNRDIERLERELEEANRTKRTAFYLFGRG